MARVKKRPKYRGIEKNRLSRFQSTKNERPLHVFREQRRNIVNNWTLYVKPPNYERERWLLLYILYVNTVANQQSPFHKQTDEAALWLEVNATEL